MNNFKSDFPIFNHFEKRGERFVYLDSAACAQMPKVVFDAMREFSETTRTNVGRGVYTLNLRATEKYEEARETVRNFLNARSKKEIIFIRNTTEGINIAAYGLTKRFLQKGDHILISRLEHHSNFLPWQMLVREYGMILDIVDVNAQGILTLDAVAHALTPRTKVVSLTHISNVFGTIYPLEEIGTLLCERGIFFVVDGAQGVAHLPVDVQKINCDFFSFSGYKIGAPTGIGVLYGREELLREIPPLFLGGGMVSEVTLENSNWAESPSKFEAGTPNSEGAIGLAIAINYISAIGLDEVRRIDKEHMQMTLSRLATVPRIRIVGPLDTEYRSAIISFVIEGIHPRDLATLLDQEGIAIRAGHHCALPLMHWLGVPALNRASFWIYNTQEDIETLAAGIEKVIHNI